MTRSQTLRVAILLAGAIFIAKSALAQSYATDVAFSQTVTSCSGESVSFSGNFHFQYKVAPDPSGGNRYDMSISTALSGVGQQSQTNYAGTAAYGYGFTSIDSPASAAIQLSTPTISDSGAKLTLALPVTVTMDTSGNISASLGSASSICP